MRFLLIAERAEYRLLVRKHVEIEWPDAFIVEHQVGADLPLDPRFTAAGFDAAVVIAAPPSGQTDLLVAELVAKDEFAPVVFVQLREAPSTPPRPIPTLHRLYGKKINHDGLIKALTAAAKEHKQLHAARKSHPQFAERYRFGTVLIRGHRCIRQVGSGGMCKIYLAESERAGALVVLKVFNQVPDVSERIIGFDRFIQEYEIVASLKHHNIVTIYDLGIADDHAYIAMEHFPAGDLRQRMKTPMSAEMALHYLHQIASALDAIHNVGVLHRDLKPANVMLRTDGSLSLIDFGLAKANEGDVELTGTREIFGTPYYMSPEQGHAELIDARSDLYSLGIVYFEMLTGKKPYTGGSAMEVIYKHKRAELPELAPQFASYEPIIRKLLAKAPADRFQTARELLDAIADLEGAGVSVVAARTGDVDRGRGGGVAVSGGAFEHAILLVPTPEEWVAQACANPDVLLIDHANCEKKAASTALSLMFAYAEDLHLTDKMSRLAREELRHYEQVAKLLKTLKIIPQRLSPGRYAERMRKLVAKSEPQREVDLMVCGAFIEARSCERFAALGPVIGGEAGQLFHGLHAAEARHFQVYLGLARRAAARAEIDMEARVAAFAEREAELVSSRDDVFRFHSGRP